MLRPAIALEELGCGGRVLRPLGGITNMHWLVGGVRAAGGSAGGRAVLRRYGPWGGPEEVTYELRVLERMATRGWPVPRALTSPAQVGRHLWCLFSYVRGGPRRVRAADAVRVDQRARGRLLAALHADLATLTDVGQRPGGRRREEVLGPRTDGPSVEEVIAAHVVPEQATIILDYAERARARFAALRAEQLPAMVIYRPAWSCCGKTRRRNQSVCRFLT